LKQFKVTEKGYDVIRNGGFKRTYNWWLKNDYTNLKWVVGIMIAISAVIVATIKIK